MAVPARVRVGFIRRPVGLRGEVLVEPLTDRPERFEPGNALRVGGREMRIREAREDGRGLVVLLSDINDLETAQKLRGAYLEVDAADVPAPPEGAHYHWDLLGLEVVGVNGETVGTLADVLEYPANDVYVVNGPGGETLIPAVSAVVKAIDIESGRMVVELPPELEVR